MNLPPIPLCCMHTIIKDSYCCCAIMIRKELYIIWVFQAFIMTGKSELLIYLGLKVLKMENQGWLMGITGEHIRDALDTT